MNIEEYRALKAEEAKEAEEGTQQEEVVEQPKTSEEDPKPEEEKEEEFIEVDGEKLSLDELRNGYLRQSDYTKKTQSLAKEKQEINDALKLYNDVKSNPEAIASLKKTMNIPRTADPSQAHVIKLEQQLYDMKLDNEINLMQSKYKDFEVKDVLNFASEKRMTNLEDAYMLLKARKGMSHETSSKPSGDIDLDSIKDQLKKEIMSEMKGKGTSSIISSKASGNVEKVSEIKMTANEKKVAEGMGLTQKEYSRWRDANK